MRRRAAVVLVLGCALLVIGLLGLVFDWGASSSTARPVAVGSASSSPAASPAPAEDSTASPAETSEAFFDSFTTAIRSADTAFLAARLHPVVIDRYGIDQCTRFVVNLVDPTVAL